MKVYAMVNAMQSLAADGSADGSTGARGGGTTTTSSSGGMNGRSSTTTTTTTGSTTDDDMPPRAPVRPNKAWYWNDDTSTIGRDGTVGAV